MKKLFGIGMVLGIAILFLSQAREWEPLDEGLSVPLPSTVQRERQSVAPRYAAVLMPREDGQSPARLSLMDAAQRELEEHRESWRLAAHHEFRGEVSENPMGSQVVFHIFQDGIPVEGEIRMRYNRQGELEEVENRYQPLDYVDVKAAASAEDTMEQYRSQRQRFAVSEQAIVGKPQIIAGENNEGVLVYPTNGFDHSARSAPVQLLLRAGDAQILKIEYARKF